jgi:acyl carrier protein
MSIKETVIAQVERMRDRSTKSLPPLTDDLVLLDSGLDSLGIAVLVTRLEDELNLDPFSNSEMTAPPVTLGEFIRIYEDAARAV